MSPSNALMCSEFNEPCLRQMALNLGSPLQKSAVESSFFLMFYYDDVVDDDDDYDDA